MKTLLLTSIAPLLWGTTYIITTEFLPDNQPLLVATVRALPVGIIFIAINRTLPKGVWWWRTVVLGVLNIGLFFSFLFIATYRIPGGIVATIGAFQPLIVLLFSSMLFGESASKFAYIFAGLGAAGVGLLVATPAIQLDAIGIGAAVAAAFSMAIGVVLTKHWKRPVSLLTFTGWQLTAGGLFLLLLTALFERQSVTTITPINVAGFLWLALLNTGLAYVLWFKGIEQLSAWRVSFLGLISPVVAMLLGSLFLGEHLTYLQIIGIILIFFSVIAVQRFASSKHNR